MAPSGSAVRENLQTGLSRGRRSRNKVSVGEPAEGSFQQQQQHKTFTPCSLVNPSLELPFVLFFLFFSHQYPGFGYQRDECKMH